MAQKCPSPSKPKQEIEGSAVANHFLWITDDANEAGPVLVKPQKHVWTALGNGTLFNGADGTRRQ